VGQFWTPILAKGGSLLHADLHLVCFNGKIDDPNEPPSVWVVPLTKIKDFIKEYKTRTVVSRSKIVHEGKRYLQAWGSL